MRFCCALLFSTTAFAGEPQCKSVAEVTEVEKKCAAKPAPQPSKPVACIQTDKERFAAIKPCHPLQRQLAGLLRLELSLNDDGYVMSSVVLRDTLRSEPYLKCLQEHVRAWCFPGERGKREIVFASGKDLR